MRLLVVSASVVLLAGLAFIASMHAADPTPAAKEKAPADPWVGEYVKLGGFDFRKDKTGGPERITITKVEGGYRLSGRLYDTYLFKPDGKGAIQDEKKIFGTIYLGHVEYADGQKCRILRGEFCYEQCLFYEFAAPGLLPGQ